MDDCECVFCIKQLTDEGMNERSIEVGMFAREREHTMIDGV